MLGTTQCLDMGNWSSWYVKILAGDEFENGLDV